MRAILRKKNKGRIIILKRIGEKMMKMIFTLVISVFVFGSSYTNVYADEIKITASIDKSRLELGDCIRYKIKVYGTLEEVPLRFPELKGFSLRFGPYISIDSEVEDNVASTFQSHLYGLVPQETGKFTIGPTTLWYKKKAYETDSFDIEVIGWTPFNNEKD